MILLPQNFPGKVPRKDFPSRTHRSLYSRQIAALPVILPFTPCFHSSVSAHSWCVFLYRWVDPLSFMEVRSLVPHTFVAFGLPQGASLRKSRSSLLSSSMFIAKILFLVLSGRFVPAGSSGDPPPTIEYAFPPPISNSASGMRPLGFPPPIGIAILYRVVLPSPTPSSGSIPPPSPPLE